MDGIRSDDQRLKTPDRKHHESSKHEVETTTRSCQASPRLEGRYTRRERLSEGKDAENNLWLVLERWIEIYYEILAGREVSVRFNI